MNLEPSPPWLVGLRAARANLWPGLCLQAVMLLMLAAYFRAGWARPWFDQLALLKTRGGYGFSMASAVVAGALLPEGLAAVFFQQGKVTRRNAGNLAFGVIFWGVMGFCVDLLYRSQGRWFGTAATALAILKKVLVDEFFYNPLFATPVTVWCYEWKARGYATRGVGEFFTARFYARRVWPTLLATWGVWIPAVTIIYSLPPLLQTPMFNLALTFWALMLAYMNSSRAPADSAASLKPEQTVLLAP